MEVFIKHFKKIKHTTMSQTIISVIVLLLAQLLPKLGVQFDSESLTTTVQLIVSVAAALWIWVRRYQAGDIKVLGIRK